MPPCDILRLSIFVAALLWLTLISAPEQALAETTLERIVRTGTVRIGHGDEAPYGYRTPDGRVTGEAPEVARRVFARLGVTDVKAVETEFGALIRELKAGRFDVIAAGMYVLPGRCAQISFSEPTYMATNLLGQGFAVRPGNPKGLHGYEDVARDGSVRLGVVAGGVEISHARALGINDYQLVIFPDTAAAAGGVRSGRVDAYAATALTVKALVDRDPKRLERAQPFRNPVIGGKTALGYGAFGFRKEDTDLLEAFNRHLLAFRGTQEHLDLVTLFGFTAAEMPDKSTADLCRP